MKTNCARKNKKLIFFLFLLNTLWFSCSFTKTIPFYLITDDEPKQKIPISCKETVTTTAKKERGINFELYLKDKTPIPIEFFDRKSKTLLIVGQGFVGIKEFGRKIARFFTQYDVVLFDYRWRNLASFLLKPSTIIAPFKKLLYEETEEVLKVVSFFKAIKQYDQVIGLGDCYSNYTFVTAQIEEQLKQKHLFSKLIMDSCWWSWIEMQRQTTVDPYLSCKPIEGGAPDCLKNFFQNKIIKLIVSFILNLTTPDISLEKYLSELESDQILFIHGKEDQMVPYKPFFKLIFNTIKKAPKAALITPFKHSSNKQNPEMYKKICELFIESKDHNEFIQSVRGLETLDKK